MACAVQGSRAANVAEPDPVAAPAGRAHARKAHHTAATCSRPRRQSSSLRCRAPCQHDLTPAAAKRKDEGAPPLSMPAGFACRRALAAARRGAGRRLGFPSRSLVGATREGEGKEESSSSGSHASIKTELYFFIYQPSYTYETRRDLITFPTITKKSPSSRPSRKTRI